MPGAVPPTRGSMPRPTRSAGRRPHDVALAALYLASDEAGFVTGVDLPVDGGLTVARGVGPGVAQGPRWWGRKPLVASGVPHTTLPTNDLILGGVLPVLPHRSRRLEPDADGLRRIVRYVIAAGADGIVYPGVASESTC